VLTKATGKRTLRVGVACLYRATITVPLVSSGKYVVCGPQQ